MADFIWRPAYGAALEVKARVSRVQFGDGYSQRRGDGINPLVKKWRLTFTEDRATLQQIIDFLELKAGVSSFTFAPENGVEGRYTCAEWSKSKVGSGVDSLTATFELENET